MTVPAPTFNPPAALECRWSSIPGRRTRAKSPLMTNDALTPDPLLMDVPGTPVTGLSLRSSPWLA